MIQKKEKRRKKKRKRRLRTRTELSLRNFLMEEPNENESYSYTFGCNNCFFAANISAEEAPKEVVKASATDSPSEKNPILLPEQKNDLPSSKENNVLLKLELVDRTAGQSLPEEKFQMIKDEIIKQIGSKFSKVKIVTEENVQTNIALRVFVDVFTSGNRTLRFWVGFGAGKAHMRIKTEWLEGSPFQIKDSNEYQRFGAASLRGGQTIEMQMADLIGQYAVDFISKHIR